MQLRGVKTPSKVARAVTVASKDLGITPDQLTAILTEEDKQDIESGMIDLDTLKAYASSLAEGIRDKRIVFHPTTGQLVRHN